MDHSNSDNTEIAIGASDDGSRQRNRIQKMDTDETYDCCFADKAENAMKGQAKSEYLLQIEATERNERLWNEYLAVAEIFVEKAEIYVRNRSSMLQLLSDPILDQIEQEELEAARALQDPQIAMRLSVEKLRQQEGSLGLPQLQHTVFQPEANSLQVERKPLARSYDLTFIRYFPASWPKPGSFPTSFRSLYNDIYMDIITRAHSEGIERSLALAKQGISNRGRPNHVDDASTPPTRLSPQLIESLFHSLDLLLSKHEGLLGALCLFLNRAYRLCSCHGLPETPRLIRIGDSSPLPRTSESYRVLESLGKLFGREVESAYRYLVEIRDGDDYQLLRKNIYTRIRKEMML